MAHGADSFWSSDHVQARLAARWTDGLSNMVDNTEYTYVYSSIYVYSVPDTTGDHVFEVVSRSNYFTCNKYFFSFTLNLPIYKGFEVNGF